MKRSGDETTVTKRGATATVAKHEEVRRGADEVRYLASRARATPLGAAQARLRVTELSRRVLAFDGYLGAESHDQGTELIELYMRHADATLGHRTFHAFLQAEWPLDVGIAYERIRIARLCTHDQAAKFGHSACLLGLRIMSALGIETFDEFLKRPLKLHAADGGGTIRFPASARQLRSVLREIASRAAADEVADIGEQMRRYREVVDDALASDPHAQAIKPVVWADARGVYLRVTAGGADQSRAVIRLFQKLARVGG